VTSRAGDTGRNAEHAPLQSHHVVVNAGSTNAVLHLIAMGRAAGVPVTLSDFQSISDKVPYLADLKPRYGHSKTQGIEWRN